MDRSAHRGHLRHRWAQGVRLRSSLPQLPRLRSDRHKQRPLHVAALRLLGGRGLRTPVCRTDRRGVPGRIGGRLHLRRDASLPKGRTDHKLHHGGPEHPRGRAGLHHLRLLGERHDPHGAGLGGLLQLCQRKSKSRGCPHSGCVSARRRQALKVCCPNARRPA